MNNKTENKPNILNLVSALCWALAILSVFVSFNEFQSLQKTKAFVTAAQKSRAASLEAETMTVHEAKTENQTAEQEYSLNFVNADVGNTENSDDYQSVAGTKTYIINKNSKKIHSPDCQYAKSMKEENKLIVDIDNLEDYINSGYTICSKCGAK